MMIDDLLCPADPAADHLLYRSEVRTGIRARTYLPSPCYDYLFMLKREGDRTLCVMNPAATADYDGHYFEVVPAP